MLHLDHSFVWCWNLDASGNRSETPGMFWNVVLEKDGEDQLDWSCENEEVLLRVNEQRNILHEIRKRKANWIGHILCGNCLLKQVIEGKIKGEMEVKIRRGIRRRKLLDNLRYRRRYSHLKEEALDRTMWRARFVFIHSVFCLMTGPKPLPKRALHIVRSRASSFKCE
jgi:hypothetical protein